MLFDKLLRRLISEGRLTVTFADGSVRRYGQPDAQGRDVAIRLIDKRVPRDFIRQPRLAIGETYMDGRLVVERGDIYSLLELITYNARWEKGGSARKAIKRRGSKLFARLGAWNSRSRSKKNSAHHYDLVNDRLYELFLDPDRQYTSAYFTDPGATLEQAQQDKMAHIAAKLALKPGQTVLDIGCGWGGWALYLNRVADVDVVGISLSAEQLKVARARAREAGVEDRVRFEQADYRDFSGSFDRITAIGMFEHVGPPNYSTFFAKCRSLLKDDGVMLLHCIGRLGGPGTTDPWVHKYIFPGGYNPALSEIIGASEKNKMISSDVEQWRLHYSYTLHEWLRRTRIAHDEIVAMYDERFFRMWEYYLAGAATGFENGGICNYQVQFVKDRRALPITRDYIAEAERKYRLAAAPTAPQEKPGLVAT